jgi:DNA-binding PadR family transcriptional regulator
MIARLKSVAPALVLTALAGGSLSGTGIVAEVSRISGGQIWLRAGSLVTLLDRLRGDGLIAVDREQAVHGRSRRFYRLTPSGRVTRGGWAGAVPGHSWHAADPALHSAPPAAVPIAAGFRAMRASAADREEVVDLLKAAFVQGRLTKDELVLRTGQALTARRYGDLGAVTADLDRRLP